MGKSDYVKSGLTAVAIPNDDPEKSDDGTETMLIGKTQEVKVLPRAASDNPAVSRKLPSKHPCADLIDNIAAKHLTDYQIRAIRLSPKYQEIPSDDIPQGPTSDIQTVLRDSFGDGVYRIRIAQNSVDVEGERGCMIMSIGASNANVGRAGGNAKEESETVKAAREKTIEEREKKAQAEAVLDRERVELERQKMVRQYEREEKHDPLLREIDALKEKLREQNQRPAAPDPIDSIVKLAPLLAVLKGDGGGTGLSEAMKEMARANERIAERQERQMEKMMTAMKEMQQSQLDAIRKTSEGQNGVGSAIKLIREMNGLREEMGLGQQSSDEPDIDPNNIWGSIAAVGIKGIYKLFTTGGPELQRAIATVASNIGRTPDNITESDRDALERELAEQMQARRPRLAAPAAQQQQQPRPQPVRRAPAPLPPPIPRNVVQMPVRKQAEPTPQQAEQNVAEPPVSAAPLAPEVPAPAPSSAPSEPVVAPNPPAESSDDIADNATLLEDDIRQEVDAAGEVMLQDILSGRIEAGTCVWMEQALERWPRNFKDAMCAQDNNMGMRKLVIEKMNPKLWERIETALCAEFDRLEAKQKSTGTYVTNNFLASFGWFAQAWREMAK
jgi:hypothetical protein